MSTFISNFSFPSGINFVRNIFSTPFDFSWYKICFEDNGSYLAFYNNLKLNKISGNDLRLTIIVNLNNRTLLIKNNSYNCYLLKLKDGDEINYSIEANSPFFVQNPINIVNGTEKELNSFKPNIVSYIKPEENSLITKSILFFIAWISFWWLILWIFKLVIKGSL